MYTLALGRNGDKLTETIHDEFDKLKTDRAYREYKNSRKDKTHLVKYPQSVKASDYYKYLESKVMWS
ncbi:hypothetical protein P3K40_09405 [Staphylococcus pseudintermedius]|uniref:hypothetical protein n=1 Tax=Staphylococcus pseudintermedius TaxID=283734 RepID=UPI0011227234|nr:hypothetical protein [Staphylococcus pseudintermedius]EGQ4129190.1 hypothetical protein [Staphylococcus pseudintermedius]EJG1263290.1 hypothetical protein [Staphylococcus pseudintermedius]MDK3930861.1 hypothetical protein [Staphylococcus pseudintermedius]TOY89439.1 hypothetical protein DJ463_08020 [Staphylococcus pseudintermedius]WMZ68995.1 hypothetical protein QS417_10535 [Staphylococcus pseudintermedius]